MPVTLSVFCIFVCGLLSTSQCVRVNLANMTIDKTDFTEALSKDAKRLLNITQQDMERVMKHYEVTPAALSDMVTSIREWVKKQPHLPGDNIRDQQIIGHLAVRGFSVEKFKHNLDDYYTARHRMPDILCDRDPLQPDLAAYLKHGHWIFMPQKTPEDYRITMFRMNTTEERSNVLIAKAGFMLTEYRIWNDVSLGECWILDLENVTFQQVVQMTPMMISNIVYYIAAAHGAKLKSVHVFNVPPFAAAVVNIFKRLMKNKLANRVVIATLEEITASFPKESLPNEYGGSGGSWKDISDGICTTLQSEPWREYFLEQNTVLTDESKRLTPCASNEIFGADGSFRQLCLD